MTYEEGILGVPKQFEYKPEIIGKEKIRPFKKIIVLGMGGSRLATGILNMVKPELDIHIHSDYDLPLFDEEVLTSALIITNSHSGNTTEPISGAKIAIENGLNLVVVSTGGELINIANQNQVPHIVLPHSDLPPRMMVFHDLIALATLIDFDITELTPCQHIDAEALKSGGTQVARQIGLAIPLIYTSESLKELGYIWKIILNETAKMPAFNNCFPEADHNEITGFQGDWAAGFHSIFLQDDIDNRISQRMDLTAKLFQSHGMLVVKIPLVGVSLIEKIISSVIIAHWTALELATTNNTDPLAVVEIEDFKKKLQN
ncbi:MAG: hypothetical protein A2735_01855 [Candidatus Yanofskybacteria bacterium RIFCSPHIGHO2_01_FULL_41_21]|uniref:SIS domain-containing protein n=1 Tax=Candidatus Yanofskybacteria bacterium RIFCSPHIGHO2_01_FULL_41_21 TaxID=1802660 RepID=A0A1F8E9B2_9BACT|nr:MAG: hypothetical protein A2735_01855 [Candidatus Yanofskybacteria bacterium RIFCSPHIGHO2_01_FULL_41_21]